MRSRAMRTAALVLGISLGGLALGRLLGYRLGTRTIVRCRAGHLFTTVWVPGVKLKAIDLGVARIQRCPIGHHWSLVVPVRPSTLSEQELATAAQRDNWLP